MSCKIVKLNNGYKMPMIGLGTYNSKPGEVEQAVKDAIEIGYRHFDCAWFYGNEAEVGVGILAKINDGTVKREDLFVTTKLWNNFHAKENVVPKIKESLKSFQLDYIDLFLVHWPFAFKETVDNWPSSDGSAAYSDTDYLETWQGMEECVKLGLTKSIGISNFNSEQITRLLANCTIKPVVNQIEVNPSLNQKKMIQFCKERDIFVTGFCPLGRAGSKPTYPKAAVNDPKVIDIGKKYNKSPAQVVLRYLISLGVIVIPKSVTKSRIEENFNLFDFDLDEEDLQYLDSCNCNARIVAASDFKDHKYFPFGIEY